MEWLKRNLNYSVQVETLVLNEIEVTFSLLNFKFLLNTSS